MQLSRVHIAFLAIMSLFTGIIGPGTKSGDMLVSYAMTDMRVWIFFLLILLVIGFYAAAVRSFRILWFLATGILLIISVLFMATLLGNIHDIKHMVTVSGLSWGWVFLIIGLILLFWSLFRKKSDDESIIGSYADMTIGVIGSITLALLSGMIILTSLSFTTKSEKGGILSEAFGSGNIKSGSGIKFWGTFKNEPEIEYDRKNDILIIGSGTETHVIKNGEDSIYSGVGKNILKIGNQIYQLTEDGTIFSGNIVLKNSKITIGKVGILSSSGGTIFLRTEKGEKEIQALSGTGIQENNQYILSENEEHVLQLSENSGGIIMFHDKIPTGFYKDIYSIELSADGNNFMVVASESGSWVKNIYKNGLALKELPENYMSDSYQSNGNHYIYGERNNDASETIYFDGEKVSYTLDEVREIFLDKSGGGSYAFFGRVRGNHTYCIFTRYRGNLCGIEAYMNPILSADGSSIVFAGKKNGIWSIYRNTELIVNEVGYENADISHDYVFFDPTNPRTYLFIRKDSNTQKYSLIKNGKMIPSIWEDIGVDQVSFGFDNQILLPAKDATGWKILEI